MTSQFTAPERHFPDDAKVDQWIADRFRDESEMDATASPVLDQLKAAADESMNRLLAQDQRFAAERADHVVVVDRSRPARTPFRREPR